MTTQYKTLTKGDIIQEGDEFKISFDPECWKLTSCVGGDATNSGRYRRPIPTETKQYRRLTKEDILQIGDEFEVGVNTDKWYPTPTIGGPGSSRYRRSIPVETEQKDCGSITEEQREIIDSERDKRNSAVIENADLKTRLENALSDKVIAHANLGDKNAAIAQLKGELARAMNGVASYADFTRQVAEALGMGVYRISFQEVVQKVQSMTFQNASLNIQIKDSLSRNGSTAQAELEKVRDAVKNFAKYI